MGKRQFNLREEIRNVRVCVRLNKDIQTKNLEQAGLKYVPTKEMT